MTELIVMLSALTLFLVLLVIWLLVHHKRQAAHIIERLESHHEFAVKHSAILREQTQHTAELVDDIQTLFQC